MVKAKGRRLKVEVVRPVQRFKKFRELSWNEQLLFSEAYFLHLTTGLILKIIPFRWIPRLFSSRQFEAATKEEAQSRTRSVGTSVLSRQSEIELIRMAIQRAGKVSPWKNRCLVSSLAGRCMLRRRKISSQISLGVAKNEAGKTIAHAWLKVGDFEMVDRRSRYTELFFF